jgi:2',3'-cyclic-nucleotide 2'-phosphodiesterase (5'-nucleotidase family)
MLSRKSLLPFLLSFFLVAASCRHTEVTAVEVQSVELNAQADLHDSATAATIAPYKLSLEKEMSQVIGRSAAAMPKERDKPETALGNFVADICLDRGNAAYHPADGRAADICLLNNGGLRTSLPAGNITRGNIFELMPFDNEIVIVTLSGKQMRELIRYTCATGGQPVAGMTLGLRPDKSPGTTLINGQQFDSTHTYKVITSDYLANGGDKMNFFLNPLKIETTGYKIRDAIIDHLLALKENGVTVQPQLDGRIFYEAK